MNHKFWFYLNLTFLKPWANQYIFPMEMFVLSYASELCIYPRLCLQGSSPKSQKEPETQNWLDKEYALLMQMFS